MNGSFFAGAFGGDMSKLPPQTRLECKICWYVYDPAVGDEVWQMLPGTAFSDLPDHWSCPECDSKKQDFLVLDDGL
ncbi:MAG: rubredoxin [Methylobacter sp.]|nr:rubredoxin [Methylobacter sp.]MDP2097923.1 rubredoxin [Methylobacter sp.]MDP2429207.1 rubredoxin [Methylobacter sp.]MDP3056303.1 rubredoxin [Methylobacter sp.]MDP3362307.1 rubredoxin [Methylobacter sp.]